MSSAQDVKKLGTIMGLWAHPDDETFSMAGIMAAAVQNGQQVICITATRGEAGVQDESRWPAHQLASIRTHELEEALQTLGVKTHVFLDYSDGGCADVDANDAIERIATLIKKYQPNSIFTFGPDGLTGHPDHKTVSAWAIAAAKQANKKPAVYFALQTTAQYNAMTKVDKHLNVFFNIDKPPIKDDCECDVCFCLDHDQMQLKQKALAAMPSQTELMLGRFSDCLPDIIGTEAFALYTEQV